MNILITGACGVTSRAVARSLKISEYFKNAKLIGTDIAKNIYGLYDGLFEDIYKVPLTNSADYLSLIQRITDREKVDLAIVIPEPEVLFWTQHDMPVMSLLPPSEFSKIVISKKRTYKLLRELYVVPEAKVITRSSILNNDYFYPDGKSVWLRDFSVGSTSGKGALKATSKDEIRSWAILNPRIDEFMISEYLPGRNFAVCLLFHNGCLLKLASYERIEYFMGQTVMSGVSGNISKGRLINNVRAQNTSEKAVRYIADKCGQIMHGLVTVDLKEDNNGTPLVTEINIRHTACTSAFAMAGANMSEAQVFASLNRLEKVGPKETIFPSKNLILRDIDGLPLWIETYKDLNCGQSINHHNDIDCCQS